LEAHLTGGGRFPAWTEDDLAAVLPDPTLRRRLIVELRPRDLTFFGEPIPVFAGWPDAVCGYLQFSSAYDVRYRRARDAGWPCREMEAGHFQMLVEPVAVTATVLELVAEMGIGP
jgi:hypothetical protein